MEPQQHHTSHLAIAILIALVAGAVGGYFYGNTKGRSDLLAEQAVAKEAEKKSAQEEIAKKANPFADAEESANPLKGTYKNPFEETSVNPFR